MNRNTAIVAMVLIAVVGIGAGFFGGMQYQRGKGQASIAGQSQGGPGGGRRGQGGGRFGGNGNGAPVLGQVISQTNGSFNVKLQDGSSKIVIIPSVAKISKTDQAQVSDITTGTMVAVFGTINADGSVTAQTVQLNPMFRMQQSPNASSSSR